MARAVTRQSINEDWEMSFLRVLYETAKQYAQGIDWQAVRHYRMGGYSPADAVAEYIEHRKEIAA